jgi:ABC-type antimicrobial peptide transport system permease subunit
LLALILVAFLFAWLDKRLGGKQRDPLRSAIVRLKYATLIAAVVMYALLIRLPAGAHIGAVDATESLQRLLDKMLQTIAIGLVVPSFWFAAAYGAVRQLSASSAFKGAVPKATREPV